jgi:hypothetical protein
VTQVRNPAKNWLRQNGRILFPFLAFAIPFMLRVIPEILMDPYLTGFDTAGYYLPNTLNWMSNGGNFWAFMADAPLMYIAVLGVISTGVPIVFSFKVLAPWFARFCNLFLCQ